MDHNKTAFVKEIVDRMKTVLGVSKHSELAEFFGGSKSGPAVWISRGSIPIAELIQLAQDKDVSLDWLILGRSTHATGKLIESGVPGDPDSLAAYAELPVLSMDSLLVGLQSDQVWRIPHSWLAEEGLVSTDTFIVRAEGDAMAGTINHGQLVIVDRRPRSIDGIYLVRFGDTVRIKRVQHMVDGSIRLSHDNTAYAADVVQAAGQIQMIGYCHAMVATLR
jgi:hypothetical protein